MDGNAKPQTILMVDDNEDDYEAVMRAFKKIGMPYTTVLCKSGQEALDFLKGGKDSSGGLKDRKPVLILLDLNMPGMDGRRVLQLLKEDPATRRIPVIIWTTSSNEKDVIGCYDTGANSYMQKPVSYDELLEKCRHMKEYWFDATLLPG